MAKMTVEEALDKQNIARAILNENAYILYGLARSFRNIGNNRLADDMEANAKSIQNAVQDLDDAFGAIFDVLVGSPFRTGELLLQAALASIQTKGE